MTQLSFALQGLDDWTETSQMKRAACSVLYTSLVKQFCFGNKVAHFRFYSVQQTRRYGAVVDPIREARVQETWA
eukprot:1875701-Amphidinium_carterae.1